MTCTKKNVYGLISVFTLMGAAQAALITIDVQPPTLRRGPLRYSNCKASTTGQPTTSTS